MAKPSLMRTHYRVPNVTTVDLSGYYKMKERDSRMRMCRFVMKHAPRLQSINGDNGPVSDVCIALQFSR